MFSLRFSSGASVVLALACAASAQPPRGRRPDVTRPNAAISANPRSAAARLYSGEAHAALGRGVRAERELKAAYEMGGAEYAAALFQLGQLYLGRGERELALRSFETYLGVAPNAVNADQARAMIRTLR